MRSAATPAGPAFYRGTFTVHATGDTFLDLRGWGKDQRRGIFQTYNWTILTASLCLQASIGLVDAEVLWFALLAFPATLFGAWLGAQPGGLGTNWLVSGTPLRVFGPPRDELFLLGNLAALSVAK